MRNKLPSKLEKLRANLLKQIAPLKPASSSTKFNGTYDRSDAGRVLRSYDEVYFALVDLLGFENLGREDKTAWSIPVDFNGKGFYIAHKKFGLGLFGALKTEEAIAQEVVAKINRVVNGCGDFYNWLIEEKLNTSEINVKNDYFGLLDRYKYLRDLALVQDAEKAARNRSWLAISAVDAFFSWTEHSFVLVGVMQSKIGVLSNFLCKFVFREPRKGAFQSNWIAFPV